MTKEVQEKDKGVQSAIKQACAQWFQQNQIILDNQFRDVKCAKKTVKMHASDKSRSTRDMRNADLNLTDSSFFKDQANFPNVSLNTIINNEGILETIIENTIKKQGQLKSERQFYDSLKPRFVPKSYSGYYYKNTGVKPPSKEFKSKQPRFITFKVKNHANVETEKPLFEDSLLSQAVKNQDMKLYDYKASTLHTSKKPTKSPARSVSWLFINLCITFSMCLNHIIYIAAKAKRA